MLNSCPMTSLYDQPIPKFSYNSLSRHHALDDDGQPWTYRPWTAAAAPRSSPPFSKAGPI